jgi:hypothetical protein
MGVFTVVSIRKGQTNIEILLGEHNYLKSYGLYRGYKFRGFIFKSEEKPPKQCLLGKKGLKTWKNPYGISKITPGYWRSKIWKYNGKSIVLLFEIPIKTLPKKIQYCKYIVLLKNFDQTHKLKLCKTKKKIELWQLKNSNCDSNKNDSSDRSSYNDIFL